MCENCNCGSVDSEKSFQDQVQEAIEVSRPNLKSHGGDIELVSVDDDKNVSVRLQGACSGCPGAKMTLKSGVERILRERLPDIKEVIAVD